jgi:ABC-type multidrug transport system fused ATPase/permease subunit
MMGMFFANFYSLLQIFGVAIFAVRWIVLLLPIILLISYMVTNKAANAIRETARLSNTSKSPLLSYVGETISGSSSIRAFEKQEDFISGCYTLLD